MLFLRQACLIFATALVLEACSTNVSGRGNEEGSGGGGTDESSGGIDSGGQAGGDGDSGGDSGGADSGGSGGALSGSGGADGGGLPVTEGLLLWLDADQVDGEPDTAVQTWPDLSGNDLDAVALSGTAAPTLVMGAIGSRPALHFDGIDDYLQLPSGFDDFSSGLSLFVVVDATVLTGGFKFFALGNGELVDNVGFGRDGTNPSLQFFVDHSSLGTHYFTSDGVLVQNEPAIYAVLQGPGSPDSDITANILKNGLSVGSGASYVPPLEERGTNYLGRSQFASDSLFQGDMAEVILFDRQLSAAERIDVHEHLQGKYDL